MQFEPVAPTLIPTPPLADYRGYYNIWSSRDGAVWSEPLAACAVTGQTLGGITAFANGASSCPSTQSRDHGGLDVCPLSGLALFAAADEWDGDQHVRMWQSKNDNIAFSGEFVLVPYAPALNLAPTRRLLPIAIIGCWCRPTLVVAVRRGDVGNRPLRGARYVAFKGALYQLGGACQVCPDRYQVSANCAHARRYAALIALITCEGTGGELAAAVAERLITFPFPALRWRNGAQAE
jgi:hypothetical protein